MKALEPYEVTVARCPWCGENRRVFLRASNELVCRDCWEEWQLELGDELEVEDGEDAKIRRLRTGS